MGKIGITGAIFALIVASLASLSYMPLPSWIQDRLIAQPAPAAPVLDEYGCAQPAYTTRIMNKNPLIMHVENFFTKLERDYLIQLAESQYKESLIQSTGDKQDRTEQRTSSSAFLSHEDPVCQCIMRRASEFQGFVPMENIESLQVTAYKKGQQYINHYDWGLPPDMFNGRTTTFFGILAQNCTNCGTAFPRVPYPWPDHVKAPCKFVECDEEHLVVKPVEGSAVFWRNLNDDGTGHPDTLHAGLPVQDGFKVGLNIWTREKAFSSYDDVKAAEKYHQKDA